MIRVGILGASGYTGSRLALYLGRHREVTLSFITSRQEKGKQLSELYGSLGNICDLRFQDPDDVANAPIDVLFTCAPDQVSMKVAPAYLDRGVKVIDLAGDFRMRSAADYERWYGKPHTSPEYIAKAVYGLTELYRDQIRGAQFVSNPGCYPTSVILGLTPLLKKGLVASDEVFVHAVSGISGAGRDLKNFKLFYEADSNVMPYNYGRGHKHVGEMEQELTAAAGHDCRVTFAPQVAPQKTGILSTMPLKLNPGVTRADIDSAYHEAYETEFFVRYHDKGLPETKFVADTNFCDIGCAVVEDTRTVIVASTICNLGKGASGQAVQNMNVMMGFPETEGLV